jgi:CubicO group peptidase (beta-lactamase class C family)
MPLALHDTYFSLGGVAYGERREDIGVYFAGLPHDPTPLLHDRVRSVAADCSPALGGYSTMADLHRWYSALLRVLNGERGIPGMPQPDTLSEVLGLRRGHTYDATLSRDCDFAAGFMVDLTHHNFGRHIADTAIGQAGWLGTSWAWADPTHAVAAAFLINGVPTAMDDVDLLRRRINDTLYEELLDCG